MPVATPGDVIAAMLGEPRPANAMGVTVTRRALAAGTDSGAVMLYNFKSPQARPAMMVRRFRQFVVTLIIVMTAFMPARADTSGVAESPLAVVTAGGQRHDFTVELADTTAKQARGLMFRESLAAERGMLFDYQPPIPVTMWMKNTLIPLDMLFVGASGVITRIVADTVPFSLAQIESGGPVRAVIELNAGTARRLGIAPGDRVVHPMFTPEPAAAR